MIDRNTLNDMLHEDVLTVTFEKKDGTERVMRCTLREDLLPPKPEKAEDAKTKKVNEAVMPVYDIEAKGFRSFRIDSIKKVEPSTND